MMKTMKRKILFFMTFAALPFVAAISANLPSGGGYSGPYIYEEEAGYGYLEGDAVYDEDAVTFDRSQGGIVIMASVFSSPCGSDDDSEVCDFCAAEAATAVPGLACGFYQVCLAEVMANGCDHIHSQPYPASTCPKHRDNLSAVPLTCPIGGNAALMLVFALPYGIVRLCRKRKKE
jgi:hypothetical protein